MSFQPSQCADDLLALEGISVQDSEELPEVLEPLVSESCRAAAGASSLADEAQAEQLDAQLEAAIAALAPHLAKLKVGGPALPDRK